MPALLLAIGLLVAGSLEVMSVAALPQTVNTRKSDNQCGIPVAAFRTQMLSTHNLLRRKHGVQSLKANATLDTFAQNYAGKLLKTLVLKHSDSDFGENIAFVSSSKAIVQLSGKTIVDKWYSEITGYNFRRPGFSSKTGHFTQVVWKNTKYLGVGLVFASNCKMAIIVANYDPAGNFAVKGHESDDYRANVPLLQ